MQSVYLLFVAALTSLGGCVTAREYALVDVYVATDRAPRQGADVKPRRAFTNKRDAEDRTHFAKALVAVPRDKRANGRESAELEWQTRRLFIHEARVEAIDLGARDTFLASVREAALGSESGDIFVFVHGFNVRFDDAVERAGRVAHHLGLDGPMVLFAWPSVARQSLEGYISDMENGAWGAPHLKNVLAGLAALEGVGTIHLGAHSMGSRVLLWALEELEEETGPPPAPIFGHLILAAADIDQDTFRDHLLPEVLPMVRDITVYGSANDLALKYSRSLTLHARLGQGKRNLFVDPRVVTVDVSPVTNFLQLNHSYYLTNKAVREDLYQLVREHKGPEERGLVRHTNGDGDGYWELHKQPPR